MRANFATSLAAVLQHEGGYVNDPQDPGGATNRGITQRVYDNWRRSRGLAPRSVQLLEQAEIQAIYRKLYWDPIQGDELPSGLDYCVFDFAVNSGPARAARYLQRAAGVLDDGAIGPATLTAIAAHDTAALINAVSAARQAFLESLPTFQHFGGGWTRRVSEVEVDARTMAA